MKDEVIISSNLFRSVTDSGIKWYVVIGIFVVVFLLTFYILAHFYKKNSGKKVSLFAKKNTNMQKKTKTNTETNIEKQANNTNNTNVDTNNVDIDNDIEDDEDDYIYPEDRPSNKKVLYTSGNIAGSLFGDPNDIEIETK